MKKFLSVLMAATMLVGVMALTGCGGDTTEPTTDEANNQSEPASTTATDLKTVTEGVLTMSTNAAFPPYESTDDSGNVVGIDADIAAAIAEKLGLKLQIDDMDFDGALAAAQSGKSDIVMAGVTVNEERQLVLDFTDTYANGVQVVIVPEGSDITSIEDMQGKRIGTQRGTTGYILCSSPVEDGGFGEENVVPYDDAIAAVKALKNGQIDCVVIDNAPAQELVKANPGLTTLETEYANEKYAIGVAKGNTALLVTALALILGIVLGVLVAMLRTAHDQQRPGHRNPILAVLNLICKVYVTVIRGTPMMVQLLIMGFVIFASSRNFTMIGTLTLGINSGAYVSEIVRGGLMSVDKGQMEAGRSLGLNYMTTMRFIVIPQAVKAILPALGNEFIILLKDTSLITVIGGKELLYAAQGIYNRTYEQMFPLIGTAALYLVLVIILSWLLGKLERRLRQSDRR